MTQKSKCPKISRTIKRREDYVLQVTFRDTDGNPIDVSGRTFSCKIAQSYGGAVTTLTPSLGLAAQGIVSFSLAKATTTGLAIGSWIGEVWQTVAGADSPLLEVDYTVEDSLG